jgi:hypothetical protein
MADRLEKARSNMARNRRLEGCWDFASAVGSSPNSGSAGSRCHYRMGVDTSWSPLIPSAAEARVHSLGKLRDGRSRVNPDRECRLLCVIAL